ncbi:MULTISPECIES: hypothetical protein [Cupriavidus]|uniref:hypothetical protein n=1 Tax=Cupriavidus TaxID=106589 RepID=UPI0015ECCBDF|nr:MULTISPECIES: hypothetical protein [Cupriavidus]MCO4860816.1 hypothetical protein [Cupriavidus sp. WGlv3]
MAFSLALRNRCRTGLPDDMPGRIGRRTLMREKPEPCVRIVIKFLAHCVNES